MAEHKIKRKLNDKICKEIATGKKETPPKLKETKISVSYNDYQAKLIKKLEEYDELEYKGCVSQFKMDLIQPLQYFIYKKTKVKTLEDYQNAYKYFVRLVSKINEYMPYPPTINDYCKFINTTTTDFNNKANNKDPLGDFFNSIIDEFQSRTMQAMYDGEIQPIPGIFVCKSTLRMKDTEAPVTNIAILNSNTDVDDIVAEWNKNKKLQSYNSK